jgi:hypothetical protein
LCLLVRWTKFGGKKSLSVSLKVVYLICVTQTHHHNFLKMPKFYYFFPSLHSKIAKNVWPLKIFCRWGSINRKAITSARCYWKASYNKNLHILDMQWIDFAMNWLVINWPTMNRTIVYYLFIVYYEKLWMQWKFTCGHAKHFMCCSIYKNENQCVQQWIWFFCSGNTTEILLFNGYYEYVVIYCVCIINFTGISTDICEI